MINWFKKKKQFSCRKSVCQEYGCQVCVKPFFTKGKKQEWVCFDKCLSDELFDLWDRGIVTTGCCCGHHKGMEGEFNYIGVEPEFIDRMKSLGYRARINQCRPLDEDEFIPKTKFN